MAIIPANAVTILCKADNRVTFFTPGRPSRMAIAPEQVLLPPQYLLRDAVYMSVELVIAPLILHSQKSKNAAGHSCCQPQNIETRKQFIPEKLTGGRFQLTPEHIFLY